MRRNFIINGYVAVTVTKHNVQLNYINSSSHPTTTAITSPPQLQYHHPHPWRIDVAARRINRISSVIISYYGWQQQQPLVVERECQPYPSCAAAPAATTGQVSVRGQCIAIKIAINIMRREIEIYKFSIIFFFFRDIRYSWGDGQKTWVRFLNSSSYPS